MQSDCLNSFLFFEHYNFVTECFYFVPECWDVTSLVWGCVQAATHSYFTWLGQGWTLLYTMRFSCPTLECCTRCYGLVNNCVKKVPVLLWFYPPIIKRSVSVFYQCALYGQCVLVPHGQWRAEGGRGAGPGHPRQGGIQRVKLQKWKCCHSMIFRIVMLPTHAGWIYFVKTCLFCQH